MPGTTKTPPSAIVHAVPEFIWRTSVRSVTGPGEGAMLIKAIVLTAIASLNAVVLDTGTSSAQAPAALSGQVSSIEEGAMEGVLVSAKKQGSNITVTVVSNAQGRYQFPATKLEPGRHSIAVRAVGYDLQGPTEVAISADRPATADLTLQKTKNLAAQLTNAEWLESMPGAPDQKLFLQNCTSCHSLQLPLYSVHDSAAFVEVQKRMALYAAGSSPLLPQKLVAQRVSNQGEFALARRADLLKSQAEFLASVNLSEGPKWPYALKTFPRPTGRATRVIITQYDLPQETRMPHDVIVAKNGTVWYDSFAEQILGKLDPKTGKIIEYVVPTLKPNSPKGSLALRADEDGNLWLGMSYQAGVARFDPTAETFKTFPLPPQLNKDYTQTTEVEPSHAKVDGKVWIEDSGTYSIYRLDLASGQFEVFQPFPIPSVNIYDIASDRDNNVYFTVYGRNDIGRIDAKTGQIAIIPTPSKNSAPRRGTLDADGKNMWFGEFRANKVGVFNTNTKTIREWTPPTPWFFPYDVSPDRNGEAWTGSMLTDRVARLDPKTGQFTEYLLPTSTNIRRTFVDDSTTPVTFWAGSNHGHAIVKLEPLD
jgi:virginiamycin B lyase